MSSSDEPNAAVEMQETRKNEDFDGQKNIMDLLNRDMEKKNRSSQSNSSEDILADLEIATRLDDVDRNIYPEDTDDSGIIILSDDDEKGEKRGRNEALSYRYNVSLKRKRSMDIARRALKKTKAISNKRLNYLVDVPENVKVLKSGSWLNKDTGQLVSRKIYREKGVLTSQKEAEADLQVLKEVYMHDGEHDKLEKYKTEFLNKPVGEDLELREQPLQVSELSDEYTAEEGVLVNNRNSNTKIGKQADGKLLISNTFPNEGLTEKPEKLLLTTKESMYINLPSHKQKEIQKNRLIKMDKANKKKFLDKYITKNDNDIADIANISRRTTDSILLDDVDDNGVEHDIIRVRENGILYIKDQSEPVGDASSALARVDPEEEEDDDLQITDVRMATIRDDLVRAPIPGNNTVMVEAERRLRAMAKRINTQRTDRMLSDQSQPDRTRSLRNILKELENYPPHIRNLFENSPSTKKFQEDLKMYLPGGATEKLTKLGKLYFKFRALRGNYNYDQLVKNDQNRRLENPYMGNRFNLGGDTADRNIFEVLYGNHRILRNHRLPINPMFEVSEYEFMERMMGQIEEMEDNDSAERNRRTSEKRKGALQKYITKINKLPFDQSCDFTDIPKKEHVEIVRKLETESNNKDERDNMGFSVNNNINLDLSPATLQANLFTTNEDYSQQENNSTGNPLHENHRLQESSKDINFEVQKVMIPDNESNFKKVNICFLCATPLRTGIPPSFRGFRRKDISFDYLVKKYGVPCPYFSLTAPTDTDRQYSKRIFIAIPCGHAYCGRCVMRISNSMKLPKKLKERRKNVIGCGNPYVYGPDKCVVKSCKGKFNKPKSFRELYL